MHAISNKLHKVSHHPPCKLDHHFWQEIRPIKVMKCPPDYDPRRDINSDPNATLKITPKDVGGHLMMLTQIELVSDHVRF